MKQFRQAALYFALILAVIAIQNSFLSRLTVFGARAMIVPIAAVACGFFEDGNWGGFFGLVAGWLCDLNIHENTVMFVVLFTAIGLLSGMVAHLFVNRNFLPFLFVSAAALLITAIFQMLRPVVFYGVPLLSASAVALKQTLLSIPFAAIMYAPFKAISSRQRS